MDDVAEAAAVDVAADDASLSLAELAVLASTRLYRSMRTGDVVLARVLTLGDRQSLFLTTAAPSLGVVHARCGCCSPPVVMDPFSAGIVECPTTHAQEFRKVAVAAALTAATDS
uniref:Exosome complex component CSL4 C-terminal domain-containing protein n=1 Tax=Sexangularia sp. CB-2014 TaxID=1486929 RepID=A0A7S1YF11_9EUKA